MISMCPMEIVGTHFATVSDYKIICFLPEAAGIMRLTLLVRATRVCGGFSLSCNAVDLISTFLGKIL